MSKWCQTVGWVRRTRTKSHLFFASTLKFGEQSGLIDRRKKKIIRQSGSFGASTLICSSLTAEFFWGESDWKAALICTLATRRRRPSTALIWALIEWSRWPRTPRQPHAVIMGRGEDDEAEPDARGDDAALTWAESGRQSALFTWYCDRQRLTYAVFFIFLFLPRCTTTADPKLSRFAVLSLLLKSCGNRGVKVVPQIGASYSLFDWRRTVTIVTTAFKLLIYF